MKRLLALFSLLLVALLLVNCVATHSEQAIPETRDIMQMLPPDTVALFELDSVQAATLADYPPIPQLLLFMRGNNERAIAKDKQVFSMLAQFVNLPWKGNLYLAIRFVQGKPVPVVIAKLDGEADTFISNFAQEFLPAAKITSYNDFKICEFNEANVNLALATSGELLIISASEADIRGFISPQNRALSITKSRLWTDLVPLTNGVFLRGTFDLEALARQAPMARIVLTMLGMADLSGIQYSLGFDGKTISEDMRLVSTKPFGSPLAMFESSAPISEEDSAIPDTAVASVRLNINAGEIFEWLTTALPQFGVQGAVAVNTLHAFFSDTFGFPDPLEFFKLFGNRIECCLDYPRGTVLPEFIVSVDIIDNAPVQLVLETMAQRFNLPSIEVDGNTFHYLKVDVPPKEKKIAPAFPYGLCWGCVNNKLVFASNVYAASAALKRAQTAALVSNDRFRAAMASHPPNRKFDIFVDSDCIAGLFNIGRAMAFKAEKAILPLVGKYDSVADTGISISSDGSTVSVKTLGVFGAVAAFSALAVFDKSMKFLKSIGSSKVLEGNVD